MEKQPVETTLYSLDEDAPEPAQRRTSERHLSLLRVGVLMIGDNRELCLIRNVSAGGMLIRTYSLIPVGTRVAIELKHGEMVSGAIKWTKDDMAGVSFDEAIDVLSLIAFSEDGPRPRMPRMEIDCAAWLRNDGEVYRARALNISQGGMCVECPDEIKVGAEVVVSLNGLAPLRAMVKWRDGELHGIGFNRVLALSEVVSWLKQQRSQQRRALAG